VRIEVGRFIGAVESVVVFIKEDDVEDMFVTLVNML
jgi:hypothetical protein